MRSDRNPYFILKASNKPHIQEWLSKARSLTIPEIQKLEIKPDLKKAMLFVSEQHAHTISSGIAAQLADQMQNNSQPYQQIFKIHQYMGSNRYAQINSHNSIEITANLFWGINDQNKIFACHCWLNPQMNPWLLEDSALHSEGTATTINMLNQRIK